MKKTLQVAAIGSVSVLFVTLLCISLNRRGPVELNSGYRLTMGTFSRIIVIAEDEAAARASVVAAFEQQERVETLMNCYDPNSEISTVNHLAADGLVPVSAETFDVLERAMHFSELSGGAFDITVGPLVDLWRRAAEANEPPADAVVGNAQARVGYDKLILDANDRTVRFAVAGMRLDLGGIAKGYAIDRSVEAMQQCGALGGMVDIGGDVRCFGQAPRGAARWRVGLQDPNVAPDDLAPGTPLLVLDVDDAAVTTSGGYRRFTVVGSQKESHIMDTETGRGAAQLASVTIIAPDATSADALATAVSVLGAEKGMALIERLPGVEAILIPAGPGAETLFSSGAAAYVK